MIGSHDTFTYLKPSCKFHNLTKRWWKTQCKTIKEQYAAGVRMFDIRVCLKNDKWTYCHGAVDFKESERTLFDICLYMKEFCPEAIYRIVLEKGSKKDELTFKLEAQGLCKKFPNLWRIDIKSSGIWNGAVANNNDKLYKKGYLFAKGEIWETPSHECHGFVTKNNFLTINLKNEAKAINSKLFPFLNEDNLKLISRSNEILYFIDYCTNDY